MKHYPWKHKQKDINKRICLYLICIVFFCMPGCVKVLENPITTAPADNHISNYDNVFDFTRLHTFLSTIQDGYIQQLSSRPDNMLSDLGSTFIYDSNGKIILYFYIGNCTDRELTYHLIFLLDYDKTSVTVDYKKTDTVMVTIPPRESRIVEFQVDNLTRSHDFLIANVFYDHQMPMVIARKYILTHSTDYNFNKPIYLNPEKRTATNKGDSHRSYVLSHSAIDNGTPNYILTLENNMNDFIKYAVIVFSNLNIIQKDIFFALNPYSATDLKVSRYFAINNWVLVVENPYIELENNGKLTEKPIYIDAVFAPAAPFP